MMSDAMNATFVRNMMKHVYMYRIMDVLVKHL